MVAVIKTSSSLGNVLHYNENKVKQMVAECIHSNGFAKDTEKLSLHDKRQTIEKFQQLNQRTKLTTVHISLNFDGKDQLDQGKLKAIADSYMQQLGFGKQPYLVYQHKDAGHPHIHIVSTNIQSDGKRISMQNIGRNQSEVARKQIEATFGLVRAQKEQVSIKEKIAPVSAQKVQYGKVETKRAITNVLDKVLPAYVYASLPELNAVLKLYNVEASRGEQTSRTYKSNGLVYRVLNEQGEKVGVPIKASLIYNKPGLAFLHQMFAKNEPLKASHLSATRNKIDVALRLKEITAIADFEKILKSKGIGLVQRLNVDGRIYGLTYVDHIEKVVFNGSDLGKDYSIQGVSNRIGKKEGIKPGTQNAPEIANENESAQLPGKDNIIDLLPGNIFAGNSLLEQLTKTEVESGMNNELLSDRTKRRKKRKHNL